MRLHDIATVADSDLNHPEVPVAPAVNAPEENLFARPKGPPPMLVKAMSVLTREKAIEIFGETLDGFLAEHDLKKDTVSTEFLVWHALRRLARDELACGNVAGIDPSRAYDLTNDDMDRLIQGRRWELPRIPLGRMAPTARAHPKIYQALYWLGMDTLAQWNALGKEE